MSVSLYYHADARMKMINKLLKIRLFNNWNDSVVQADGELLIISQFTLYGKLKGNKVDFHLAMKSVDAELMYDDIVGKLSSIMPGKVKTGTFGAMMEVAIVNDGRKWYFP